MVYKARDTRLQRLVAIKLIPAAPHSRRQTKDEARSLARLAHPNIVEIFDVGECHEGVYLVMEYVAGGDLRRWLIEHGHESTPAERTALLRNVAEGLREAHRHGIVHGDLKPENVLMGVDGRPRIADFGLASVLDTRQTGPSQTLSDERPEPDDPRGSRIPMGTPCYMAPEQHAGARPTARSDQFTLCVLISELCTGRRPFDGTTTDELADAKRAGPTSLPAERNLRHVIRRGLSVDRHARWTTLDPIVAALEPRKPPLRRAAIATVAAVVALGAVVTATNADRTELPPDKPCALAQDLGAVDPTIEALGRQRPHAALRRARWALAEASTLEELVRARLGVARLESTLDDIQARQTLERLYSDAIVLQAHAVAFEAALLQAEVMVRTSDPDAALPWLRHAKAQLEAAGATPDEDPVCHLALLVQRVRTDRARRTWRPTSEGLVDPHEAEQRSAELLVATDGNPAAKLFDAEIRTYAALQRHDYEQAKALWSSQVAEDNTRYAPGHPQRLRTQLFAARIEMNLDMKAAQVELGQIVDELEDRRTSPTSALAFSLLGRVLARGNLNEADATLHRAADQYQVLGETYGNPIFTVLAEDLLARFELTRGDNEAAEIHAWRAYEAWQEAYPTQFAGNRSLLLAHVFVAEGRDERARAYLDNVLERETDPALLALASLERGRVHMSSHRWAAAVEDLERASAHYRAAKTIDPAMTGLIAELHTRAQEKLHQ